MTFIRKKFHFHGQNSDDLFFNSLTRFLGCSLSFPRFSVSFAMFNVVYDPFLTRTTAISEKNSFMTPFYSVHTFARIRQHYFSKYWGDGCMGRPNSNFVGPSPSPSRSPPLSNHNKFL